MDFEISNPLEAPSWELRAFTEAQVQQLLGLSRGTVRQLRLSGELAAFRIGRSVRYPASSVANFIRTRTEIAVPQ